MRICTEPHRQTTSTRHPPRSQQPHSHLLPPPKASSSNRTPSHPAPSPSPAPTPARPPHLANHLRPIPATTSTSQPPITMRRSSMTGQGQGHASSPRRASATGGPSSSSSPFPSSSSEAPSSRPARGPVPPVSVPGAVEVRVSFQNEWKERLVGKLVDTKSEGLVILCHGYANTKDAMFYPDLAAELARKKLSSLRFDFSGNGESEGVFQFANYHKEAKDLRAAVEYARNTLRRKVVGIVGHSKGGDVVLLYASIYDDVPFVVNISGRYDLKRGMRERYGADFLDKLAKLGQLEQSVKNDQGVTIKFMITKQDVQARMELDMAAAAQKITLSEVLTVHGSADKTIPVEDATAFGKVIRNHMLYVVDGADHNYRSKEHADKAVKKIVDYLTDGL